MNEHEWLAEQFETYRTHLQAVAYRMLGSLSEADDAVQESWLRLSRSDASGVENLGGWLTTVVARVCLDILRSRKSRREEPLETSVPEPTTSREGGSNPKQEVLLADSVGLALRAGNFDTLLALRSHSRACGHVKRGPWCASRSQAVLRTRPGSAICCRERIRRNRRGPAGPAVPRPRSHDRTRQDRRDQRDLRPRASPPTRPGSPVIASGRAVHDDTTLPLFTLCYCACVSSGVTIGVHLKTLKR